MELKITTLDKNATILEIVKDGKPVNAQNPVSREELGEFVQSIDVSGGKLALLSGMPMYGMNALACREELKEFVQSVDASGRGLALLSGMPMYGMNALALRVGNMYAAIATYDPREGGYIVVKSTNPEYKIGQLIPKE